MNHIKQILAHFIEAMFNDAHDTSRTLVTGFIVGTVTAFVPYIEMIGQAATVLFYAGLGGIGSMIGKEVFNLAKAYITKKKSTDEKPA